MRIFLIALLAAISYAQTGWVHVVHIEEEDIAFHYPNNQLNAGKAWWRTTPYTSGNNWLAEEYRTLPVSKVRVTMNGISNDFTLRPDFAADEKSLYEIVYSTVASRQYPVTNEIGEELDQSKAATSSVETFAHDANVWGLDTSGWATPYYCTSHFHFNFYRLGQWIPTIMGFFQTSKSSDCTTPGGATGVGLHGVASGYADDPNYVFYPSDVYVLPFNVATNSPTPPPTGNPSPSPTPSPTKKPTTSPSNSPTPSPTKRPTTSPSNHPSPSPTDKPTNHPLTSLPTPSPTKSPTPSPTQHPTMNDYVLGDRGGSCDSMSVITSLAECRLAIQQLGIDSTGEWTVPESIYAYGCSIKYTQGNALHFNTDTDGVARYSEIPVCKTGIIFSIKYEGSDQYFSNRCDSGGFVSLSSLPSTTSYTIKARIKPDSYGGRGIVGWGNYQNTNQVNALRLTSSGINNYWWDNDLETIVPDLDDGDFHDVIATWDSDSGVREIFVDGISYASQTASGYNAQPMNFCVGKTYSNEYFRGHIEYVEIYDRRVDPTVKYWVDDGCHRENPVPDDVVGAFRSSEELHGVRCCSNDGSTCTTSWNCNSGTQLTFQQARVHCVNEGNRLCTRVELETDMCCATGGGCDHYGVWTSTSSESYFTNAPSFNPTTKPSKDPTELPSFHPTFHPTMYPTTTDPSKNPSAHPSQSPSLSPTMKESLISTVFRKANDIHVTLSMLTDRFQFGAESFLCNKLFEPGQYKFCKFITASKVSMLDSNATEVGYEGKTYFVRSELPVARIIAPSVISGCDKLVEVNGLSSIAAGRYKWFVDGKEVSRDPIAKINITSMTTYVQLVAYNSDNMTSSANHTILMKNDSKYTITILEPSVEIPYNFEHESVAEVHTCDETVYYEWQQIAGPPVELSHNQRFSKNFITLPSQLEPLQRYVFQLNGCANLTINVKFPDPIPLPARFAQIGPNSTFHRTDFFTNLAPIYYHEEYYISLHASMENSTAFDIESLIPFRTYFVQLILDNSHQSEPLKIQYIDTILDLSLRSSKTSMGPKDRVVFEASSNISEAQFTWQFNDRPISEYAHFIVAHDNLMVVDGSKLEDPGLYSFHVNVEARYNKQAINSTIFVDVNHPPRDGSCRVHGVIEAFREVEIKCSGWIDADQPLQYNIGLLLQGSAPLLLSRWTSLSSFNWNVVPGNSTVLVYIRDNLGSSTTYPIPFEDIPLPRDYDVNSTLNDLQSSLDTLVGFNVYSTAAVRISEMNAFIISSNTSNSIERRSMMYKSFLNLSSNYVPFSTNLLQLSQMFPTVWSDKNQVDRLKISNIINESESIRYRAYKNNVTVSIDVMIPLLETMNLLSRSLYSNVIRDELYIKQTKEVDAAFQIAQSDALQGRIVNEEVTINLREMESSIVRVESNSNSRCGKSMNISLPQNFTSHPIVECIIYRTNKAPELRIDEIDNVVIPTTIVILPDRTEIDPPDSEPMSIEVDTSDHDCKERATTISFAIEGIDDLGSPSTVMKSFEDYSVNEADTVANTEHSIPQCVYFNEESNTFQSDGCYVINYSNEAIQCACDHHTTFTAVIQSFRPNLHHIEEESWKSFSFANVLKYPTALIVSLNVFILLFISLLVTDSNTVSDKSLLARDDIFHVDDRPEMYKQTQNGKELEVMSRSISSLWKVFELYPIKFKNTHVLYSIYARDPGSNLSNRYRLFSFAMYIMNILLGDAMFYGLKQDHMHSDVFWSCIIVLCSSVPIFFLKKAATSIRPHMDVEKLVKSNLAKIKNNKLVRLSLTKSVLRRANTTIRWNRKATSNDFPDSRTHLQDNVNFGEFQILMQDPPHIFKVMVYCSNLLCSEDPISSSKWSAYEAWLEGYDFEKVDVEHTNCSNVREVIATIDEHDITPEKVNDVAGGVGLDLYTLTQTIIKYWENHPEYVFAVAPAETPCEILPIAYPYTVTRWAEVTKESNIDSDIKAGVWMQVGETIEIVEFTDNGNYIRGRLQRGGWITISNIDKTEVWAEPVQSPLPHLEGESPHPEKRFPGLPDAIPSLVEVEDSLSDIEKLKKMDITAIEFAIRRHLIERDILLKKAHKTPYWGNYFMVVICFLWASTYFILILIYGIQFERKYGSEEYLGNCESSIEEQLNAQATLAKLFWLEKGTNASISLPRSWSTAERWMCLCLISVIQSIFFISPMLVLFRSIFDVYFMVPCLKFSACVKANKCSSVFCCCFWCGRLSKMGKRLNEHRVENPIFDIRTFSSKNASKTLPELDDVTAFFHNSSFRRYRGESNTIASSQRKESIRSPGAETPDLSSDEDNSCHAQSRLPIETIGRVGEPPETELTLRGYHSDTDSSFLNDLHEGLEIDVFANFVE